MNDEPTVDHPEDPLSIDTRANLLSHHVRAELLALLADADGAIRVDIAVAELASQFEDGDRRDASSRCALLLHHVHLPKLMDHGVIERREDELRLGPNADGVLDLVTAMGRH